MTNETKRKVGIIGNIVAIIVCLAMLMGTTFAWFTDTETNSGNVIKSGTLNVEAYFAKGTEDPANANWINLEGENSQAVYNYDKWEPGYVSARHFKIANEGSLAFKYKLVIVPNGAVSALAEVIDVYYVNPAVQLSDRANLSSDLLVGTLADLIADPDGAAYGAILPAGATANNANEVVGETTATVVFKMRESAGNDYYDMSIGSTFDIKVIATQYAYESDDLDTDYDAGASLDDAVLVHGGVINMQENVEKELVIYKDAQVTINMNDKALNNTITNNGTVSVNGGEINVESNNAIYNEGSAELKDVTLNMTNNTGYITNSRTEDSVTIYENVTATSSGGGVNVWEGEAVFKSGTITTNSTSTNARHMFYVANGATLTIEDGEFFFNPTNLTRKGSYICADENATVIVKGGVFHKPSTRTAPIQALNNSTVTIYGGRFQFDPSAFVADGYKAVEENGWWTVTAE